MVGACSVDGTKITVGDRLLILIIAIFAHLTDQWVLARVVSLFPRVNRVRLSLGAGGSGANDYLLVKMELYGMCSASFQGILVHVRNN